MPRSKASGSVAARFGEPDVLLAFNANETGGDEPDTKKKHCKLRSHGPFTDGSGRAKTGGPLSPVLARLIRRESVLLNMLEYLDAGPERPRAPSLDRVKLYARS